MSVVKSIIIGVVLLAVIIGVAVWAKNRPAPSASPEPSVSESVSPVASASVSPVSNEIKNNMHEVTITTNLGDIVFQTYDADTPKTVENFVTLAGKGFYKDVIFHRVIEGFMIQGGDPTGTGSGGPGYQFADELNPDTESYKKGYTAGTVAMANAGPNTNGSQFFIMHKDYPLPHSYTIFGHVVRGQDVVDKIATTTVDGNDKPLTPVAMKKVTVKPLTP
ncbi:MAG: peptidylprolyl isomerase [Patescibacteria group bacterium]